MKQTTTQYPILLLLCFVLWLTVGCGADTEALQATANAEIAAAVTATLEGAAHNTPYPTQTAYATATAYATPTAYATATPYPTATLYPTATPYPTVTATPTPEATSTPVPAPTQSANNNPPAAPPPATNPDTLVLQYLNQLNEAVGQVTGLIDTAMTNNGAVDCQAFLTQNDRIMALPTLDVSSAALPVQGAYGEYRGSIEQFAEITLGFTDSCRTQVAAQGSASIPGTAWELARSQLVRLLNRIGTAIRLVGGG